MDNNDVQLTSGKMETLKTVNFLWWIIVFEHEFSSSFFLQLSKKKNYEDVEEK